MLTVQKVYFPYLLDVSGIVFNRTFYSFKHFFIRFVFFLAELYNCHNINSFHSCSLPFMQRVDDRDENNQERADQQSYTHFTPPKMGRFWGNASLQAPEGLFPSLTPRPLWLAKGPGERGLTREREAPCGAFWPSCAPWKHDISRRA